MSRQYSQLKNDPFLESRDPQGIFWHNFLHIKKHVCIDGVKTWSLVMLHYYFFCTVNTQREEEVKVGNIQFI